MTKPSSPFPGPTSRICSISPARERNEGDISSFDTSRWLLGSLEEILRIPQLNNIFCEIRLVFLSVWWLSDGGGSVRLAASGAMTEKLHPCAADISGALTKLRA